MGRIVAGLALAVAMARGGSALAGDGAHLEPLETLLFFSGTNVSATGQFAHGGLLWSPGGLARDGFTFKLLLGGGTYFYDSGALGGREVTGTGLYMSFMPGWRLRAGAWEVLVYGGPDIQNHHLSPDDPGSRLRGTFFGARGGVDVWYQPQPDLMAQLNASVSTIGTTYSARVAFGWRVLDAFFVGPEAAALDGGNFQQYSLGLHATALRISDVEWSAGFGWANDSDDRSGPYARVGLLFRR